MSDKGDSFWGALLVCIFIGWMIAPIKNDAPEKTFYFAYCNDTDYSALDCPGKLLAMEMTYKVLINEQKVINKSVYWVPGKSRACTVFDAENWMCEEAGQTVSVRDGQHYESSQSKVTKGEYAGRLTAYEQIGWLRYKFIRIKGWI